MVENFRSSSNRETQADLDSKKVAALNDQFRKTFLGGRVMMTRGIQSLGQGMVPQIMDAVRSADHFDSGNDPYGEHDFGAVAVQGIRCFWKIDYYDKNLQYHSPDKRDPSVTERVLTVMLANEY